jgi:hypothetical protein
VAPFSPAEVETCFGNDAADPEIASFFVSSREHIQTHLCAGYVPAKTYRGPSATARCIGVDP